MRAEGRPTRCGALTILGTAGLAVIGAVLGRAGVGDAFAPLAWRMTTGSVATSLLFGASLTALAVGWRKGTERRPPPEVGPGAPWAWLVVVAGVAVVAGVHVWPARIDAIAREDGLVEWVSAAGAAAGAWWAWTAGRGCRGWWRGLCWLLAAGLIIVAGEEVSWFQRLVGYGTPAALGANAQGESNVHNLATDHFQGLYYLGATAALVVLPFLLRRSGHRVADGLRPLTPGPVPMALAVAAIPFAYARSGQVAHHLTFWLALAALIAWDDERDHALRTGLVSLLVAGHAAVLVGGADLARPWAPSEYREMFVALAFAAWSRELSVRAGSRSGERSATLARSRAN